MTRLNARSKASGRPAANRRVRGSLSRIFDRRLLATARSWSAYAVLPLIGLITAPILARALGPVGRGELAAILQPTTVAGAVASIGAPAAVAFFVAKSFNANRVQRLGFATVGVSTSLVILGLFFYSFIVSSSIGLSQPLVFLLWLGVIPGAFFAVRRAAWQGTRRYGPIDVERSTSGILRLVVVVSLFILGVSSAGIFAAAYLLASFGASLALLRPLRPADRGMAANGPSARSFVSYSVLASMGTIAFTLNNRLDQALLPATVSATELGYYSVAVTVAEVPLIISTVTARNLMAESAGGVGSKQMTHTAVLGGIGMIAVCGLAAASVPLALPAIFGADFAGSIVLTQLLLLAAIVTAVGECLGAVITGKGFPGWASLGPAVGALTTIAVFIFFWREMTVELAAVLAICAQAATAVASGVVVLLLARSRRASAVSQSPEANA